jgi:hypothetical protein
MNKEINIELKWNNTCCRSVCPITGDWFRPYWGLYPFLEGTWEPISVDALSEIAPEFVDKIIQQSSIYQGRYDSGDKTIANHIIKMKITI